MSGTLLNYKSFQFYYELVLKVGRYKKKVILFYPFGITSSDDELILDYRLSKLASELMYNISKSGDEHHFLDKIVRICELT